jgi:hypothetical protein
VHVLSPAEEAERPWLGARRVYIADENGVFVEAASTEL